MSLSKPDRINPIEQYVNMVNYGYLIVAITLSSLGPQNKILEQRDTLVEELQEVFFDHNDLSKMFLVGKLLPKPSSSDLIQLI